MTRASNLVAVAAFILAGLLSYGAAVLGARWIEASSIEAVSDTLADNGIAWVEPYADGLQLVLTGTAPTEAARFRAITLAGQVIDAGRLIDAMDVVDAAALAAPRFSLEILRNTSGISLIGLVPKEGGHDSLIREVEALAAGKPVTDMIETADYPVPETWDAALRFGISALADLPKSKISIEEDRVSITAVSNSTIAKRNLETSLARRKPADVRLAIDISAPRPVVTPFILRLTNVNGALKFDACTADTAEARDKILAAATKAGFADRAECVLGLGVPTITWGQAGATAIAALAELPGGTLTISDADVTLVASETTDQALFDRVVGRLKSDLPDVFSVQAVLPPRLDKNNQTSSVAPEFVATLSPEGIVQMRGRLLDAAQETAVLSFARAHFGVDGTYIATRPLDGLPGDWTARVFAGLEGLSYLNNGSLVVEETTLTLRGVTGSTSTTADLSRVLSQKLGQSAQFEVDVRYDEALDPLANIPTPEECVDRLNAALGAEKINFAPGSADFDASAAALLDVLAEAFEDCDYVPVEIGGHTDSQGREEMNRGLSQQRADAVRNALIGRGVPPGILTAVGYGETQPIADNATEEGRELNRRIAFALKRIAADAEATPEAPEAAQNQETTPAEDTPNE